MIYRADADPAEAMVEAEAEEEAEAKAVSAQQLRLLVAAGASDLESLTLESSGALYKRTHSV
jgi:hypothetical protein